MHGLEVVTTRVGLAAGWIRDGDNGLLVPHRDAAALAGAVDRTLTDPALRARLGAAGRQTARECFDPERIAAAHAALYERLRPSRGVPAGSIPASAKRAMWSDVELILLIGPLGVSLHFSVLQSPL